MNDWLLIFIVALIPLVLIGVFVAAIRHGLREIEPVENESKGGTNPPNTSTRRPRAPGGIKRRKRKPK